MSFFVQTRQNVFKLDQIVFITPRISHLFIACVSSFLRTISACFSKFNQKYNSVNDSGSRGQVIYYRTNLMSNTLDLLSRTKPALQYSNKFILYNCKRNIG